MNVLVTGGAGYIGLEVCRQFLERGDRVRLVDRFFFGEDLPEELAAIERIEGDIRAWDDRWLEGIEIVSHLAGLSNDPTAEYDPEANWQMNALGTERLAAACVRAGVARLIFGSSASIYDGLGPGMFDESAEVKPRGAYSLSKRYGEEALLAAASAQFAPVILRQGTVYGYSPRMRFDLVVNTFVKDALVHRKLFLHGGGWQWRPLVEVRDVAQAHVVCATSPRERVAAEIFNVMQANYQIRELAMLVAGSLGLKGRPVELE
ncbi:MAG: SDR family oxidoreductase, partial [Candidatus Eremiobacteraeota bacterium]|nr:SDR family oxidoreductase [Candidatus Eremiobacteraeota bacterium]